MRLSRILLWAIAITAGLTVILPVVLYQYPIGALRIESVVMAGVFLMIYLVCAMTCAAAMERGRWPLLMRSGILAGGIAMLVWLGIIATQPPGNFVLQVQRFNIWPTVWLGLMMLVAITLLPPARARWWILLRATTILALSLLALEVACAFAFYPDYNFNDWEGVYRYEEYAVRIGGVLALIAGVLMFFTMLTAWIPHFLGDKVIVAGRLPYWLRCPRCQREQSAHTGLHECQQCGLKVRVDIT